MEPAVIQLEGIQAVKSFRLGPGAQRESRWEKSSFYMAGAFQPTLREVSMSKLNRETLLRHIRHLRTLTNLMEEDVMHDNKLPDDQVLKSAASEMASVVGLVDKIKRLKTCKTS